MAVIITLMFGTIYIGLHVREPKKELFDAIPVPTPSAQQQAYTPPGFRPDTPEQKPTPAPAPTTTEPPFAGSIPDPTPSARVGDRPVEQGTPFDPRSLGLRPVGELTQGQGRPEPLNY
jgi:hypothetical protein